MVEILSTADKNKLIEELWHKTNGIQTLIFCKDILNNKMPEELARNGYKFMLLHKEMEQIDR